MNPTVITRKSRSVFKGKTLQFFCIMVAVTFCHYWNILFLFSLQVHRVELEQGLWYSSRGYIWVVLALLTKYYRKFPKAYLKHKIERKKTYNMVLKA